MVYIAAALYVVGGLLAIGALVRAYLRIIDANKKLKAIDAMRANAKGDEEEATAVETGSDLYGFDWEPVTYANLAVPREYYFFKTSALIQLREFRNEGMVALLGITFSTVASVWSLFL